MAFFFFFFFWFAVRAVDPLIRFHSSSDVLVWGLGNDFGICMMTVWSREYLKFLPHSQTYIQLFTVHSQFSYCTFDIITVDVSNSLCTAVKHYNHRHTSTYCNIHIPWPKGPLTNTKEHKVTFNLQRIVLFPL